ncbi:hypothetical protein [Lysinibacillus xylanilyticus]|uniref:hypothetical protein n=1 Tax=Lysinibacillus xylanilyticus TaxID=582475 RepID=UPI00382332DB
MEDSTFIELVEKIEKVFSISLPYENKKGRFIAEGDTGTFIVILVDKIDELSDILCDEHYTLEIRINEDEMFNYERYEADVITKLKNYDIRWKCGIWSKTKVNEEYRKIHPKFQVPPKKAILQKMRQHKRFWNILILPVK